MVGFSWKLSIIRTMGGALRIMVNFIHWLNSMYTLGYYDGMDQISWDLWTLTLWLFGQRNSRGTMTTPTHTRRGRTEMEHFGLYSKTVYESNFGRFTFWTFVTRTNNNVACLIFFKCDWQKGPPNRQPPSPIRPKKWTFGRKRNKMKPMEMCTRLVNKLETAASHFFPSFGCC